MKRAPNCTTPRGELAAVLDASPDHLTDKHSKQLDEAQIRQLADDQELSRRQFDAVLAKPSDEWRNVNDPKLLSQALVTVLDHIRGPALSHVAPHVHQHTKPDPSSPPPPTANGVDHHDPMDQSDDEFTRHHTLTVEPNDTQASDVMRERANYIPLRLSQQERKTLRLVEAALNVSEYTDVVDALAYSRMKMKHRIHAQIRDLCSILTGLAVAMDYNMGQNLVSDRNFADNSVFFQNAFEISRRHKIANPEKSRETYGKLIHMLQDSASSDITHLLEFSCVRPLRTVSSYLQEIGGLELLEDPLVHVATQEIIPDGKSRRRVQKEIQQKERAVELLAKRYKKRSKLGEEEIRRCLYSIGDNNAYLRAARDPCDVMIKYLHSYFKPDRPSDRLSSLSIQDGSEGARLTHDHVRQFRYVFQSLALWREVCHEMYKLWYLSEKDLLNPGNVYHLRNTGQGLNRVQAAPNVANAMHEILERVQERVSSWVGSSVVHLGDYNVPNALTFIDKYAQVQRILGPLVTCIRRIEEITKDNTNIATYVTDTFGGVKTATKMILRDFFRHAFDGSGGSDWFSAGSCIDGRLTSAWNWCSDVEKKPYWPLFLLTGFTGFDGDF